MPRKSERDIKKLNKKLREKKSKVEENEKIKKIKADSNDILENASKLIKKKRKSKKNNIVVPSKDSDFIALAIESLKNQQYLLENLHREIDYVFSNNKRLFEDGEEDIKFLKLNSQILNTIPSMYKELRETSESLREMTSQHDKIQEIDSLILRDIFKNIASINQDFVYGVKQVISPYIPKENNSEFLAKLDNLILEVGQKLQPLYREKHTQLETIFLDN